MANAAAKKAKQFFSTDNPKHTGIEIRARRKLDDPDVFNAMLDEMQLTVEEKKKANPEVRIEDLDISQNKLSMEQFEALFQTLTICAVPVARYRMFGCPTLNDDVAMMISEFFKTDLTNETVPSELHLSDCAVTTDGFLALMDAFETSELYPLLDQKTGKSVPLYLRLENNYIDEASIKEKADSGCIRHLTKKGGVHLRTQKDANHRIDLVCYEAGKYEQKSGTPPPPEQAAPPKFVNDWKEYEEKGKGKGGGKSQGKGWSGKGQEWGPPGLMQQQWMKMMMEQWPAEQWPDQTFGAKGGGKGGGGAASAKGGKPATGGTGCLKPGCKWCALGECWSPPAGNAGGMATWMPSGQKGAGAQASAGPRLVGTAAKGAGGAGMLVPQGRNVPQGKGMMAQGQARPAGATSLKGGAWKGKLAGQSGSAADRSRTPIGRGGAGAAPPSKPPPAASKLPHPWEEHFDEDNQIPYFWNAETGEAVWEKSQCV